MEVNIQRYKFFKENFDDPGKIVKSPHGDLCLYEDVKELIDTIQKTIEETLSKS